MYRGYGMAVIVQPHHHIPQWRFSGQFLCVRGQPFQRLFVTGISFWYCTKDTLTMSTNPPSNVKIYDRPERKTPSVLVLVVVFAVFATLVFLGYRAFFATRVPTSTPVPSDAARVGIHWVDPIWPLTANYRKVSAGVWYDGICTNITG
jgi:hypothetical protein